jgi:hypothetical protein
MSSGMNFMYGHIFGAHSRKPHIDTVRAIHRSNADPYITSPFGVDPSIAKPGPRDTPFLRIPKTDKSASEPIPTQTTQSVQETPEATDIDDIINMITTDPQLKSKPISKGQRILRQLKNNTKN